MKAKSRDKLITALKDIDFRGVHLEDAAKMAGLSVATVRRILSADDGTIKVMATKYGKGSDFYGVSITDKLTLRRHV